MTQISLRRDAYRRGFMDDFIALVPPRWTREALDVAKSRGRRVAMAGSLSVARRLQRATGVGASVIGVPRKVERRARHALKNRPSA